MRLQHLHLLHPVPYRVASRIQDAVVRQHIDFGLLQQRGQLRDAVASRSSSSSSSSPLLAAAASTPTPAHPNPLLLTFQTTPTYTCGRREISGITSERIAYLTASGRAAFETALRGGQTTFHGPGQVTAYLVLSLRQHGLTPRCYVRYLEDCVIRLCATFGVPTVTTADPGVWLARPEVNVHGIIASEEPRRGKYGGSAHNKLVATDSKICAVGVHMRRGVTSHGLGLNVSPDLGWFQRIVACGLAGKRATSLEEVGVRGFGVREVGITLAEIIARSLKGVGGINAVDLAGSAEKPGDYSAPSAEG